MVLWLTIFLIISKIPLLVKILIANTKPIIVGNKCEDIKKRKISYDKGQKLADELDYIFMETSTISCTNINHLFDVVVREWLYRQPDHEDCVIV